MKYAWHSAVALAGALTAPLVWGVAVEPRLIARGEEVAVIPALPAAWEGRHVALIADLQVGMWLANTGTIRRIVARLVTERPALVLIAGDFIYRPRADPGDMIARAVALVRPLPAAGIPTYAVLGNHDFGIDRRTAPKREQVARRLRAELDASGVRVLHNEAVPLPAPDARAASAAGSADAPPLYLVGIGSAWAGEDRSAVTVGQVPAGAPRLVMMHHPYSFPALPPGSAPLAVAAHTHGGQVRPPLLSRWSRLGIVEEDTLPAMGWSEREVPGAPGNRLYVTRGIGFSIAPIRFNCRPELSVFTLRSPSS